MYPCIPEQKEFGSLGEGKLENPEKNLLEHGAREKTNNKLNPHIGVDAGI